MKSENLFKGIGLAVPIVGDVISGHMQANAAKKSSQLQTDSANHAADVEAQSAREALDFQRQTAENAYKNAEATRHANYDQWAATMRRRGSIGAMLGLPAMNIPDYVPGVDPGFGTPAPAPTAQPRPMAPGASAPTPPFGPNNTGVINPRSVGALLMPGVPPGSTPINGGINPDAWAYVTPDGRMVRGMRTRPTPMTSPTASTGALLMGVR